ncbi:MAG: UDP-N-acetylglucosamine 1-carboxyvinyltransferase, partial [Clostridia bacterium]|nr:UDP-N-acetylglucosamine 1-carboxyvinyltransferase [Clostridia bacterium]
LCKGKVVLKNMPTEINDVKVMVNLLREAGMNVSVDCEAKTIVIDKPEDFVCNTAFSSEASKIRYSLLLMPLGLSLRDMVSIPSPGGCNLGDRKYDIHIETLEKLGASVVDDGTTISCKKSDTLKGTELLFHIATTSGSEAAIIAGALANGKTVIKNANTRPEVIDLVNFLNQMGAKIKYKTRYIEIEGVSELHGGEYSILSDRHEGMSYAILAAMCRGEIRIKNFTEEFVKEDVELLREIGVDIFPWGGDLFVSAKSRELKPFSMATGAYPGINSDMQPLFAALALTIQGETLITDTRFTGRFQYVSEFKKLGACIENYENCVIIQGGAELLGTDVVATDLRAGAALTFLGGVAKGTTMISNYYQTERGYENIVDKLKKIGFIIEKTAD